MIIKKWSSTNDRRLSKIWAKGGVEKSVQKVGLANTVRHEMLPISKEVRLLVNLCRIFMYDEKRFGFSKTEFFSFVAWSIFFLEISCLDFRLRSLYFSKSAGKLAFRLWLFFLESLD